MSVIQSVLFFLISFAASVIGAICGIGGGVIIKPVLDLFGWCSVHTISFLSGCTVLSMSCYSVLKSAGKGDSRVNTAVGTPLAIGAVLGGMAGSRLFDFLKTYLGDPDAVGAVQSVCLALITLGAFLYTVCRDRIRVLHLTGKGLCLLIGFALGVMSSFLGIGGGPINLIVLFYFFGMDTKTAAANSLYIILFSQIANLITTVVSGNVPPFTWHTLAFMIAGGIAGGMLGRKINKRIENSTVDKLFLILMLVIILISIYNFCRYAGILAA